MEDPRSSTADNPGFDSVTRDKQYWEGLDKTRSSRTPVPMLWCAIARPTCSQELYPKLVIEGGTE
jgi:hypothetical protein